MGGKVVGVGCIPAEPKGFLASEFFAHGSRAGFLYYSFVPISLGLRWVGFAEVMAFLIWTILFG